MPGLVGAISLNGEQPNPHVVAAMRDILMHRDWYKTEDFISSDGEVVISRVHLDVSNKENQPYSGHNGRVKIFLHGQIYYDQSKKVDPLAWICGLYEKYGQKFVSFLKGDFIIVIVDEDEHTVLIANDRIASKPLFYFQNGQTLYFGPEIKSLLPVPALEKKLWLPALADFLANGHFTADHTLIEGIHGLDSATVLQIKPGAVIHNRYRKFEFNERARDHGADYYREELSQLLRQAVHRCLLADHRYGILLSGGYDSRGILGCYLEERTGKDLETISWGREENIPHSDCVVAKRLAQKLGARHGFYQLSAQEILDNFSTFIWLGEGLTDFPESYAVFDKIREQQAIEVVLRGDECFGLSRWTTVHDELSMFRCLNLRALWYMEDYQKVLKSSYYQQFCEIDADTRQRLSGRCGAKNIHNRKDFYYLDTRLKYYLNPLNYVKNFALESFRPLLDDDILDFVTRLPLRYRLGKWFWRVTVSQLFPELYQEMAQTHNMINWASALRSTPAIQRFVYHKLVEEKSVLSEFVNINGLKEELDTFFAPSMDTISLGATANVGEWLSKSPQLYHFVHKGVYYIKKRAGKINHTLESERLILRLLILTEWTNMFLNYPVGQRVTSGHNISRPEEHP